MVTWDECFGVLHKSIAGAHLCHRVRALPQTKIRLSCDTIDLHNAQMNLKLTSANDPSSLIAYNRKRKIWTKACKIDVLASTLAKAKTTNGLPLRIEPMERTDVKDIRHASESQIPNERAATLHLFDEVTIARMYYAPLLEQRPKQR